MPTFDNPILQIVVSTIAAVITIGIMWRQSDKSSGEAWRGLVEPYKEEVEQIRVELAEVRKESKELRSRLERQEKEISILINGVSLLTAQIRAGGMSPVWEYKKD